MLTFCEFFAGGGMVRLGLGPEWKCLFANDIDPKKASAYRENFNGAPELKLGDVAKVLTREIEAQADLVWASFPCQDLSLAGSGAGLDGDRSGAFWPFWRLVNRLISEGRKPGLIALENVCGTLTSHEGKDFAAIADALTRSGYKFGAVVLDAARFVPHSRPRLFIIGIAEEIFAVSSLQSSEPLAGIHPPSLIRAQLTLSVRAKRNWVWWRLPYHDQRTETFADLIEENPRDVFWDAPKDTKKILSQMSPKNLAKVQAAQLKQRKMVGSIYRRTRIDDQGKKVQRAEVRFDDIAGCLRTPGGGSSRQRILVVHGNDIRSRLLSGREAARLMGIPENYILPNRYNDAYHLIGDGVAVPVVRHLSKHLLAPLVLSAAKRKAAA
jgi:DNA (cytosine-5)-methyltransferase 1